MNHREDTSILVETDLRADDDCALEESLELLEKIFSAGVNMERLAKAKRFGLRDHRGLLAAVACIDPPSDKSAYIWLLGVRPVSRRRGYGTFLLGFVRQWALRSGYSRVLVKTHRKWEGMRALLRKTGWVMDSAEVCDRDDGVAEFWQMPLVEKPKSIVLVGANPNGRGGEWALRLAESAEWWHLAAVVDADQCVREYWAARGIPCFHALAEIPSGVRLDAALIAVPPGSAAGIQVAALRKGLGILVEKPIAASLAEAMSVVNECGRSSGRIVVGVQRRSHPSYVALKAFLGQTPIYQLSIEIDLGKPVSDPVSGHRADLSQCRGGALIDLGYHALDLAHYILDGPVQPLNCFLEEGGDLGTNLESSATVFGRSGRSWARIAVNRHGGLKREQLTVQTKEGLWRANRESVRAPDGSVVYSCEGTWEVAERGRLAELAACVAGTAPREDLWEHLAAFEVIEEAYSLSAKRGVARHVL